MTGKRIGVLGLGTWGAALARMLSVNGYAVEVWSAIESEVAYCKETKSHPKLPGIVMPDAIEYTTDIAGVCREKDVLLFAVPSVFVRSTATKAAPYIPENQIIVDVAKGIEPDTLMMMSEVIQDSVKKPLRVVALSGPTHAEEVAQNLPTTIVSACEDVETSKTVQDIFMNTCMRVYTNTDIHAVELCGALKNIIALAAGISDGIGYGDNAKAAIITRGMAEMTRLGTAMGCKAETFAGLAGMGDLIVTATSKHSRNNRAGHYIGEGYSAEEAIEKVGMVVEGINALPAAMKLAKTYHVELPIMEAVNEVVKGKLDARVAVQTLMSRNKKMEF